MYSGFGMLLHEAIATDIILLWKLQGLTFTQPSLLFAWFCRCITAYENIQTSILLANQYFQAICSLRFFDFLLLLACRKAGFAEKGINLDLQWDINLTSGISLESWVLSR